MSASLRLDRVLPIQLFAMSLAACGVAEEPLASLDTARISVQGVGVFQGVRVVEADIQRL